MFHGRHAAAPDGGRVAPAAGPLLPRAPLHFDPAAEAAFRGEFSQNAIHVMRLAMAAGVVLYAAFGALDPLVLPGVTRLTWTVRYAVVCPAILAVLAFSFTPRFKAVAQPCMTGVFLLCGLGLVVMMAAGPRDGRDVHYAGLILVALGATISRMRPAYTAAASVVITVAYVVMAGWVYPRTRPRRPSSLPSPTWSWPGGCTRGRRTCWPTTRSSSSPGTCSACWPGSGSSGTPAGTSSSGGSWRPRRR